jgi:hypothetical protein
MNQTLASISTSGLQLVKKPVQRAEPILGLREGSTGRLIPAGTIGPVVVMLPRVMAVGEPLIEEPEQKDSKSESQKRAVGLAFYRKYTEALLRRYLRLSMQTGRVPSLMGREIFRGNVTHYRARGLEDVIIFCHDMERRLAELSVRDNLFIKRIALQRYSQDEAAVMFRLPRQTCQFQYGQAIDHLTELLLEVGLLDKLTR